MQRKSYAGDITALHGLEIDEEALLCMGETRMHVANTMSKTHISGCGGSLLVFSLDDAGRQDSLVAKTALFNGHRVHGISSGRVPEDATGKTTALSVHDGRVVRLLRAGWQSPATKLRSLTLSHMASTGALDAWVMCTAFLGGEAAPAIYGTSVGQRTLLLVGKSDNSLELLQISAEEGSSSSSTEHSAPSLGPRQSGWMLTRLAVIECSCRQLLYSMSVTVRTARGKGVGSGERGQASESPSKGQERLEIWVAAGKKFMPTRNPFSSSLLYHPGTILNEILVWRAITLPLSLPPLCNEPGTKLQSNGDLSDLGRGIEQEDVPEARQRLQVRPAYRCLGHEGSVFGVSWDEGGDVPRLVSTSDDRSARIWQLPCHGEVR